MRGLQQSDLASDRYRLRRGHHRAQCGRRGRGGHGAPPRRLFPILGAMALGGIIRGKRTTLRIPTEEDLPAYSRWMADLRVRRISPVWHEPAMPATWKERLKA